RTQQAMAARSGEVQRVRQRMSPLIDKANQARDAALAKAKIDLEQKTAQAEAERDRGLAHADKWLKAASDELERRKQRDLQAAADKYEHVTTNARREYDEARAKLEQRLRDGL